MPDTQVMTVSCPTCKKAVAWSDENAFRPFCSKRCQLIDLGEWANETYKIADKSKSPDALDALSDEELAEWIAQQSPSNPPEIH